MFEAIAKFFGLLTRGLNTIDNVVAVGELHSEHMLKQSQLKLNHELASMEKQLAALEAPAQ